MSRKKRQTEKIFKVFCEGDTEYNYFEYIRKNKKALLAIRPVNMNGGEYSNFLSQIQQDANSNCLAKFIVIDGDRALTVSREIDELKKIIEYCNNQNKSKRIPHILIIDFPDFEYVACLHTFKYKGQKVEQYIQKELKYTDIDDFKADKNIYKVLVESGIGSIEHLLSAMTSCNAVISNNFIFNKAKYEIVVNMTYDMDNLGIKGTNFGDFYKVLHSLEVVVN